jgi:hypothetical protein
MIFRTEFINIRLTLESPTALFLSLPLFVSVLISLSNPLPLAFLITLVNHQLAFVEPEPVTGGTVVETEFAGQAAAGLLQEGNLAARAKGRRLPRLCGYVLEVCIGFDFERGIATDPEYDVAVYPYA